MNGKPTLHAVVSGPEPWTLIFQFPKPSSSPNTTFFSFRHCHWCSAWKCCGTDFRRFIGAEFRIALLVSTSPVELTTSATDQNYLHQTDSTTHSTPSALKLLRVIFASVYKCCVFHLQVHSVNSTFSRTLSSISFSLKFRSARKGTLEKRVPPGLHLTRKRHRKRQAHHAA